ncbi:uncharacterized protein LOC135122220 [Zophobas morio]|uniref:uncharacterized protein LOC135122220 n=1 Tax=Zophobas morio TaxID=2755281 RepID=UPI003082DC0A
MKSLGLKPDQHTFIYFAKLSKGNPSHVLAVWDLLAVYAITPNSCLLTELSYDLLNFDFEYFLHILDSYSKLNIQVSNKTLITLSKFLVNKKLDPNFLQRLSKILYRLNLNDCTTNLIIKGDFLSLEKMLNSAADSSATKINVNNSLIENIFV